MIQLRLPFPEWSPAAVCLARHVAWDQHITERYPITTEEEHALPPNVRLNRFVPLAECENCAFACEDHRISPTGATLICLKDHFAAQLRKEKS